MVTEQKTMRMPEDTLDDPDLIDAQVRINAYDRLVTSTVTMVITGQPVEIVSVMYDPDLDAELSALHQNREGRARQLVEQYRAYKVRLDKMMGLAMEIAHERK
jgi:hypothetical protein